LKLPDPLLTAGDRLLHFASVSSTMDEARAQVASFDPNRDNRIWIVADQQTGGRGRQGRSWESPIGNLHMTLLMQAPCALRHQPKIGFVAGVALCSAIRSFAKHADDVTLKWPNDLLLSGAKISGLLLEGHGDGHMLSIGIGVNIVAHPDDTPYPATSLHQSGISISAKELFGKLAMTLHEELKRFSDGYGFSEIRKSWLDMAAHLNQRISVRQGEDHVEGIFIDIDADGQLLLKTDKALMRIAAGDVFPLDK
jgi:BirA family transcriptional regulator, biotin operon repressor / biotin---[acetyl-CoA-carboxylase] ligase